MKEIKVEFHRFDNFVFGRVLSMPEELRGVGEIISNDSYSICSYDYPASNNKTVALRGGEKDKDNYYFSCNYKNSAEAQSVISEFEKLIKKWNAEHHEILDAVEKDYLVAVIKPFKKNIKYITKVRYNMWENDKKAERIEVLTHKSGGLCFPTFEVDTMYKGMEIGKRYSLKELGLE